MANAKKSTKQSNDSPAEEGTDQPKGKNKNIFAVGDTPIVITGGSVKILHAMDATDNDRFEDDPDALDFPDPSPGKTKRKLRHRKTPPPTLKRVVITDRNDPDIIFQEIDLRKLGIERKCSIWVYYD